MNEVVRRAISGSLSYVYEAEFEMIQQAIHKH